METRPRTFERNEVFDTPSLSLRNERKLIRLREYGDDRILTYKGPPEVGPHKVREEIETEVADAAAMHEVLARLGYTVTFRYEKYRTEFTHEGGLAVLDETPIGVFVELEGEAQWIDHQAARLGFSQAHYITMSYGSLYFAWCAETRVEPGHMEFPPGEAV